MEHYGIISLLPAITVVTLALLTRRTLEPLLLGAIVGFFIIGGPTDFFQSTIGAVYTVMMDAVTVWVILVCMLFGSLIALLEKSGGALGFSAIATKFTKNRKRSLIVTWILGIIVFVDDYLNALAVGVAMRNVTDKYKVPREFLAYIINSTGAAVCVLIPFSTWSAFMTGQMEAAGAAEAGGGTAAYISTIPYILYAWIAVILVPLFCLKVIPVFGPMKNAEKRAQKTGQTLPHNDYVAEETAAAEQNRVQNPKAFNFVVPMLILAGVTVYTSDMLTGVIISIFSCIILYLPQKLIKPAEFGDTVINGAKDMVLVLTIVVSAFILQQANDALGLAPFVIESVKPILSPNLLPAISFIIISLLAFATGSFWGIAAIAFPIIIPLAQAMDVSVYIASGAVISGAVFGSHSCFYSDAATLTCASAQIKNNDYARTVLPLLALPLALGIIAFLVVGFTV